MLPEEAVDPRITMSYRVTSEPALGGFTVVEDSVRSFKRSNKYLILKGQLRHNRGARNFDKISGKSCYLA
jgi:hypothetical protein